MTPTRLKFALLVFAALIPATIACPVRSQEPPARSTYMGRRIAPTMSYQGADWLVRADRQKEEDCATLLKELRLKAGMTVCDMGCGNGYYALQMAEQVGAKGKVLGVDIQPEMLRFLQARAEERGITNVEPILGKIYDPMLPKGKVDLILCVDVYHEFSHPEHMLKAMHESLSPDGVVVLAEYREEDPQVPILPLHKMSKQQVMKELISNGFKLVREFDGLPWQHLMFFGRDHADAHPPNTDNDILLADFEGDSYGDWIVDGDAFGTTPPHGTLPNQQEVRGFLGKGLVNTYRDGDTTKGTATSPPFEISRDFLVFAVGGGHHPGQTGVELIVEGKSVRTVTGHSLEQLRWHSWDLKELRGKQGRIRIFDTHTGGYGHINADHFYLSDEAREGYDTTRIEQYRKDPGYYKERYRPSYHFTPEVNWMNDPNGLVYFEGEYHLFYQHNPFGNSWGHMSWGHAVSSDLIHWKHLPIALYHENDVMIFSGCCVIDWKGTSGFGQSGKPPMVAVYTGHGLGKQTQCLAYSNDRGRTWTKYAQNPVLDLNKKDFRDPKVFWHQPTEKWVMVVSLAVEKRLRFYGSVDLKNWSLLSEFGPAGVKEKPNWECPDLFELPIEGEPGQSKWVLEVDMGGGAVAGGSGGEYFVGDFDGTTFTSDHAPDEARWVDYGRDFYAPVSWSDIPESDGRRIWIGWMNNWETNQIPTTPWRSAMSIPRVLSLRRVPNGLHLIQKPVAELERLARPLSVLHNKLLAPDRGVQYEDAGQSLKILARFRVGDAEEFGIRVRQGDREQTVIGYDTAQHEVFVDRTRSGEVDFHPSFAGRHAGPLPVEDGVVTLLVFVDSSSVEVFGNDGYTVITERIFPNPSSLGMEVYAKGGRAILERLDVWKLENAMP